MPILNSIASWLMKKRMHQIELFMKYPHDVQSESLANLLNIAKNTEWGKKYHYSSIASSAEFKKRVPVQDYDTLKPFIERIRRGEQNILWPDEIKWFAKSAGTTGDKSKFIPVSQETLEECHYRGGKDMVSIYCSLHPETELFTGKNLALGGSHQIDTFQGYESYHGDVSAIVIQNLPMWAEFFRAPNISIALMNDWEEKLDLLARSTMNENITSIAGVPSWMLVLLKHILDLGERKTIHEVWPNLEVFFHGGVSFSPYKEQFKKLWGSEKIKYIELYNASEGFFGIQDSFTEEGMLLMLDYGIYYEFAPLSENENENHKTLSLDEVKTDTNYALIISTTSGLWRYKLGDTIKFTSLNPYRFNISGRTKNFINAFGEEVIVDNAEQALKTACERTGAVIREYTAGPVFMSDNETGAHEWLIEFEKPPENPGYFSEVLDNTLKSINSDYEAKRYRNFTLREPIVKVMPKGIFYNWFKSKNKLGGQSKVPRLSNDRKFLEEILSFQLKAKEL